MVEPEPATNLADYLRELCVFVPHRRLRNTIDAVT
jgi:hypothetical protein